MSHLDFKEVTVELTAEECVDAKKRQLEEERCFRIQSSDALMGDLAVLIGCLVW